MTEILKDRALMFSADDGFWTAVNDEGTGPYLTDGLFSLTEGETYTIIINGTTYTGEAVTATVTGIGDVVGIGNADALTGGEGNGEPYAAGFTPAGETGSAFIFMWFDTATAAEAYTISLYEGAEEESNVVLAEQTLEFVSNDVMGVFYWQSPVDFSVFPLVEGQTYTVVWDGNSYSAIAKEMTLDTVMGIGLGNEAIVGIGEDNELPFLFAYVPDYDMNGCYTTDTDETNTVAIYKGVLEEEDPDTPTEPEVVAPEEVNLSLYDRNGNTVIYSGIKTVTFNTDVEGTTATFSLGTAPDETTVVLDLKEGDQVVQNTETGLIKKAIIQKPEGLAPENIKKGVEIAGVEGELIGTGVTKEVGLNDLDLSTGSDSVLADPETLMSEVVITKPEALKPENIAKDVKIAGILGTFGSDFNLEDENLQYFAFNIDQENKVITLYKVLYSVIYEKTGSYDVIIPDTIGGYNVVIAAV